MNCSRFVHAMNNTTIINCDDRSITKTKTQHCQIMATIGYKIFKFEHKIKKTIVAHYTLFAVIAFSRNNSFTEINSIVTFIRPIYQIGN